jgi:hypothetical protein
MIGLGLGICQAENRSILVGERLSGGRGSVSGLGAAQCIASATLILKRRGGLQSLCKFLQTGAPRFLGLVFSPTTLARTV